MKFAAAWDGLCAVLSLPSRGAWIEINPRKRPYKDITGRSPRGERGLKFPVSPRAATGKMVAPLAGSVD